MSLCLYSKKLANGNSAAGGSTSVESWPGIALRDERGLQSCGIGSVCRSNQDGCCPGATTLAFKYHRCCLPGALFAAGYPTCCGDGSGCCRGEEPVRFVTPGPEPMSSY